MIASQRKEPGDPRAKVIEAAVKAAATRITRFGWPYRENATGAARVMAEVFLAALEAEGWGLTSTREGERLREAIRAELAHGGIRDRIAQETAVLGAESEKGSPVRRAAERLDRDRDAFYERMTEALSSGPVEEEEKP